MGPRLAWHLSTLHEFVLPARFCLDLPRDGTPSVVGRATCPQMSAISYSGTMHRMGQPKNEPRGLRFCLASSTAGTCTHAWACSLDLARSGGSRRRAVFGPDFARESRGSTASAGRQCSSQQTTNSAFGRASASEFAATPTGWLPSVRLGWMSRHKVPDGVDHNCYLFRLVALVVSMCSLVAEIQPRRDGLLI